jgi:O-methyltransferase domain
VQHSVYEELSKYPERVIRFKDAMKYFQSAPGFEVARVLDSFDWDAVKDGTVVDVGGSHGVVSIELARRFPLLRFVVQDRDEVVAESSLTVPEDVADRVTFMAYDFFTEQPVKNADAYFFRWIFHNWSDKYCVKILRALIPALKPGAWLLIQDLLLPEPGTMSCYRERNMRWVCYPVVELKSGFHTDPSSFRATDLGMMGFTNSKERDRNDWIELLKEADPGFVLKNIKTPPKSELSLVEIVWEGQPASKT